MKEPLFSKSTDELREAFVRNRLGQQDEFGYPDIEHWVRLLAKEAHVDPDAVAPWLDLLLRNPHVRAVRMYPGSTAQLAELATPRQKAPRGWRTVNGSGNLAGLLDGFDASTDVYYGVRDLGAIIVRNRTTNGTPMRESYVITNPHAPMCGVEGHEIMEAIFAEWFFAGPKAAIARAFCCDLVAEAIRIERRKAEHDFDTAVAVSRDGTKVAHADWVVVGELRKQPRPGPRYDVGPLPYVGPSTREQEVRTTYRAAAFTERKARRSNDIEKSGIDCRDFILPPNRTPETITAREISDIARFAENRRHADSGIDGFGFWATVLRGALLITCTMRNRKSIRILLVHRDDCPDGLPPGEDVLES